MQSRPSEIVDLCFPHTFDAIHATFVGDPPAFYDDAEARARYDSRKSVTVVPLAALERRTPWVLYVSPQGYRYSVTYFSVSGVPLRDVTWEREGERIARRRTVDLFYPEGEPTSRIPYVHLPRVTQQFSVDGAIRVILAGPMFVHDEVVDVDALTSAGLSADVPAFDHLASWVERDAPDFSDRFGDSAVSAARDMADGASRSRSEQPATPRRREWRVRASAGDLSDAVEALRSSGPGTETPPLPDGICVLDRGIARIVPLAAQTSRPDPGSPRREQRRRMMTLADDVEAAYEHREGRGVALDLADARLDSIGSYTAALNAAQTTDAKYWVGEDSWGVVLTWAGDVDDGTLTLALHIVPAAWVSEHRAEGPVTGIDVTWSWDDVSRPGDAGGAGG